MILKSVPVFKIPCQLIGMIPQRVKCGGRDLLRSQIQLCTIERNRIHLLRSLCFLLFFLLSILSLNANAASPNAAVRQVRIIEADRIGVSNPAGLAFSATSDRFLVVKSPGSTTTQGGASEVVSVTPREKRSGSGHLAAVVSNPLNFTVDIKNDSLLILQFPGNQLHEIKLTSDGTPDPEASTTYDVQYLGLRNPQGLSMDPGSGDLFVFDRAAHQVVRISPSPETRFSAASVSTIDLQGIGLPVLQGLAFDPTTTHFHFLSPVEKKLYEFSMTGEILAERDLFRFNLRDPKGMCFAPSGDLTDDPERLSLYIADSGLKSSIDQEQTLSTSGSIVELSLVEPVTLSAAEETSVVSLVQTIDTSQFNPPSPDPAGICYLEDTDTLMVSDSEVNEMSIFTGDNLFKMSRGGALINTLSTLSFSTEPTGVAFNPQNRHLYFSDDNEAHIIEMDPGPDGVYATTDDVTRIIDTSLFDNYDPEGLTFDTWRQVLFIVDGINSEVYRLAPGVNGEFDGIPPQGDDQVTSFDTESLGVVDPEGVTFDSDNGLIYIIGEPAYLLAHITADGHLTRMIDISAANPSESAGLAYAPGSAAPDAMNIYVTDRGVDNNVDPSENDGKIYELTLPPYQNRAPIVSMDVAQIVVLPNEALLDGSAFDDGLPNPPGMLTFTWTVKSGPGTVTFADPGNLVTSAGFTVPGVYLLELTATDGEFSSSDEMKVLVADSAVSASADASVSVLDADSNLGGEPYLEVESLSDGSWQKLAYLRFELSGLTDPVDAAFVGLKISDHSRFGSSIHLVNDSSWDEETITYNNRPNHESQALDISGTPATGDVVLFDVSSAVQENGTYNFAVVGGVPSGGTCAGGNDGSVGDSSDPGYYAANSSGEKIYFSQFSPLEDGIVSFLHYEEFSTAATIRAGIYDVAGGLLSSCDEQSGNNSNPSVEMHCALEPPVCLESGQSYHLGVWVGKDGWAGTAYGGPGNGTYYNSDVASLPSSLSLPGVRESGSTSIRITANNSADTFYPGIMAGDVAGFFSRENPESPPTLNVYSVVSNLFVANDDPDAATTPENTPITTINVLLNDQLTENTVISSYDTTSVNGGSVADNDDGTFLFTPALYYAGSDSFTYTLSDNGTQTSTATVTVVVLPENSGQPVAVDDPAAASTPEDTPVTTSNVLLNDQLVDNATIIGFSGVSATGGTLTDNGDGTFVYVPALNFSGNDSFTYTLSDDDNETSTATVTVHVTAVNDAPVISGVPLTSVVQNSSYTFIPLADDVDGDSLTFSVNLVPSWATFNSGTGELSGIPDNSDVGTTSGIIISVSDETLSASLPAFDLTVLDSNDAPLATSATITTAEDTTSVGVTPEVTDPDVGDSHSFSLLTQPSVGSAELINNQLVYTPAPNLNGNDSFSYRATDQGGLSVDGVASVTVTPVNDAPVISGTPLTSVVQNSSYSFIPLADDVDGDSLTFSVNLVPSWATFNSGTGELSGTPDNSDVGTTSGIIISVSDETLSASLPAFDLTVVATNSAPQSTSATITTAEDTTSVGVTPEVTDPDVGDSHSFSILTQPSVGSAELINNQLVYTPDINKNGNDSFSYRATDQGGLSVDGVASVTVTPVNDAPLANALNIETAEDTTINGTLSGSDVDGDGLSYRLEATASNGTANVNGDGSYSYASAVNFNGEDSFSFIVNDGNVDSLPATVDVTVTAVNDAPVISGVPVTSVVQGISYSFIPLADDVDGDSLSFSINLVPSWANFNSVTGELSGIPVNGDVGTISGIIISVSDETLSASLPAFDLTVLDSNDAPLATAATITTAEDTVSAGVTPEVTDPDSSDSHSFSILSQPSGGSATVINNQLVYTPALNWNGSDIFNYRATDQGGLSVDGVASVTVTPVNDAPLANALNIETAENTTVTGTLDGSDVDGDSLIYRLDAAASNGTANVNADGTYSYTPASGYTGEDSFSFIVNDGSVDSAPATVTVLVMPLTGGTCVDGSDGIIGDSFDLGENASNPHGETVYFSSFTPVQAGSVSYLHYEEYSTAAGVRAGIYDSQGILLAACVEQTGNNSNPSAEMHCALPEPVCLESGQTYYLGVWVGDDRWAGTAYAGSGTGTYYNSWVPSLPSALDLPGKRESGTTSMRMTANNSPNSF